MVNNAIEDFYYYEIRYRDTILSKNNGLVQKPKFPINSNNINISEDTNRILKNVLHDLSLVKSKAMDEIKFSDLSYELFPRVNEKTSVIGYEYRPLLHNNKKGGNVNDYIDRFNKFDINNLPLIEVVHFLKIKVEKSNSIKSFGLYRPYENKIILGTDYIPTFIHELAHAVDYSLSGYVYENNYTELLAELSAIVLCKMFLIPIDLSYSMYYLDSYTTLDIDANQLIHRVSEIVETIFALVSRK